MVVHRHRLAVHLPHEAGLDPAIGLGDSDQPRANLGLEDLRQDQDRCSDLEPGMPFGRRQRAQERGDLGDVGPVGPEGHHRAHPQRRVEQDPARGIGQGPVLRLWRRAVEPGHLEVDVPEDAVPRMALCQPCLGFVGGIVRDEEEQRHPLVKDVVKGLDRRDRRLSLRTAGRAEKAEQDLAPCDGVEDEVRV